MERHLWLIGMMGSGKTATAAALGRRLEVPALDTDGEVAAQAGRPIAELWSEHGEQAFRAVEREVVVRFAEGPPSVIATGGGVVLDGANVEAMRASGRVVWLRAAPGALAARVGAGRGRPLLEDDASPERLAAILAERVSMYEAASDYVVETSGLTVDETAARIEAWWKES